MRCFIAIDLSQELKNELGNIQKQIPEAKLKLVDKKNLHLTLVFLDELTDYEINQIKNALKQINFKRIECHSGKLGIFPSESFIKVIWVSLEPVDIVKRLHEEIFNKIKEIGKFDKRFESHITLARVKFITDKAKFIEKLKKIKVRPLKFEIKDFSLKKSTLTENGPIYEDIIKFKLS